MARVSPFAIGVDLNVQVTSSGPLDLIGDARRGERLRRPLMHMRPRRDEIQDDAFGFRAVSGAQNGDPVGF